MERIISVEIEKLVYAHQNMEGEILPKYTKKVGTFFVTLLMCIAVAFLFTWVFHPSHSIGFLNALIAIAFVLFLDACVFSLFGIYEDFKNKIKSKIAKRVFKEKIGLEVMSLDRKILMDIEKEIMTIDPNYTGTTDNWLSENWENTDRRIKEL
jgi:hypothetical protein